MNIAIVIFGQPRFVNSLHCYQSQKNMIFSQGDVDVYAHLWTTEDASYQSSSWSGMNECPVGKDDVGAFIEKWNPARLHQEPERPFSSPILFKKIKERFPDPHWNELDFNKSLAHLYSLEQGIKIFESCEKEYDWVVFLRTDVCIWDFPDLSKLEKDAFYYSSIFHAEHFADICYITSPQYVKGLKAYSYLTDDSYEIVDKLMRPCAEQFKKETFISAFGRQPLKQILLPVRVVRNNEERGNQW